MKRRDFIVGEVVRCKTLAGGVVYGRVQRTVQQKRSFWNLVEVIFADADYNDPQNGRRWVYASSLAECVVR